MNFAKRLMMMVPVLVVLAGTAIADEYVDTVEVFRKAGESGQFFSKSYGYAVFPTIGKGGVGLGGAHGTGRVFEGGKYVGDSSMTQLTLGFQLGGQAYSQIIFFENKQAFDKFTAGNFAFGAQANAVAITASASAQATTSGSGAGASANKKNARTVSTYQDGLAVFTVAKGGLMYEASIGGQKYSYKRN